MIPGSQSDPYSPDAILLRRKEGKLFLWDSTAKAHWIMISRSKVPRRQKFRILVQESLPDYLSMWQKQLLHDGDVDPHSALPFTKTVRNQKHKLHNKSFIKALICLPKSDKDRLSHTFSADYTVCKGCSNGNLLHPDSKVRIWIIATPTKICPKACRSTVPHRCK